MNAVGLIVHTDMITRDGEVIIIADVQFRHQLVKGINIGEEISFVEGNWVRCNSTDPHEGISLIKCFSETTEDQKETAHKICEIIKKAITTAEESINFLVSKANAKAMGRHSKQTAEQRQAKYLAAEEEHSRLINLLPIAQASLPIISDRAL